MIRGFYEERLKKKNSERGRRKEGSEGKGGKEGSTESWLRTKRVRETERERERNVESEYGSTNGNICE